VIPKENLLGEIGKGHKIAFNILNIGRFKLGAGVTGGAKAGAPRVRGVRQVDAPPSAIRSSTSALIQHKLGEMAILAYAAESMVYRTAGMIDRNLAGIGLNDSAEALRRIEEYDVECSMVKVWCSEMVDYVVDEAVQLHGGAGYVEDYPRRALLARRPRQPDLRGHERDQPSAGAGAPDPPRHEGRAPDLPEGNGVDGRGECFARDFVHDR
jgi:alkylation response protein AidB-like acyl-CoA dehydrogenase